MAFAITNVRIFDGEYLLHEKGHLVVKDGKIAEISPLPAPSSSVIECIDGSGCTLLPGLIDTHIHSTETTLAQEQSIVFGITTVLCMHNEPEKIALFKKEAANRKNIADIKATGLGAVVEGGWPAPVILSFADTPEIRAKLAKWPKVQGPEGAEQWVLNSIAKGSDYIKLFQESGGAFGRQLPVPTEETQKALVQAAHKHGMLAVGHIHTLNDALILLRAGVDGLTHTFIDVPPTPEVVSLAKQNNTFLVPTLATMASQAGKSIDDAVRFMKESGKEDLLDQKTKAKQACCYGMGSKESNFEYAVESVRQFRQAGLDVVCGSDAVEHSLGVALGLSFHHELSLFVEKCGFSPAEALRSATALAAKRFRLDDRGRLAPGLLADLLLVKGDPTSNIRHTLDIQGIWREGVRFSGEKSTNG